MDHAVGTRGLAGETHTKCVAYEGMIDGCHVFITAGLGFVRSRVFDGGPEVEVHCATAFVQPGFTYSGAPSASANLIASLLIYITVCHIIIYLELLALSLSVLHHMFMLLWLQKQCSWKPQMDLQWLIISFSVIICRGDNIHTCNLFLHQTAVLMMHVL